MPARKNAVTIGGTGTPVLAGSANTETPEEQAQRLEAETEERKAQYRYEHDTEAQKGDGEARIAEILKRDAEFADETNAGRRLILGDEVDDDVQGDPAPREGEAMPEAFEVASFVNLATDRAPGEGDPETDAGYNTISGKVVTDWDLAQAQALPPVQTEDTTVYDYEMAASVGRFQEFGSENRWPLKGDCGLSLKKWHQDVEPKRCAVIVHTPTGEKIAYLAPNRATAAAYLEELEKLVTV